MTSTKLYLLILLGVFFCYTSKAQIVINEVSNKNSGQIADEDNEFNDWIELYNPSASAINLAGYYLSDDSLNFEKWALPSYLMPVDNHLIVFASAKNRTTPPLTYQWESPVLPQHTFDYIVPTALTPANWMKPDFIPTDWGQGKAGFGFGDNDDATVVPENTNAIYIRKSFILPVGFSYNDIAFHIDYDDGFVAYLNGVEIGRKNIDGIPTWNSGTTTTHEAMMYSGLQPEKITIDTAQIRSLLVTRENVFAIEVHNNAPTSTDISLIPYLSFKVVNSQTPLFDQTPSSLITSLPSNLHANFKIDGKGEKIYLFNKKENTLEMVWVKQLTTGWSLGRVTDGAPTWGIFIQPTPGTANSTKAYSSEREPKPLFSISEGFYTTKQTISLSTTSLTAEIHYTVDGSEPMITSPLYNGKPITISATGLIRATSFSKLDNLPSPSVANTYFITAKGHSLPVLSIITNNSNLYGSTGIFDNWQQEWERPCYVEYFDKEKKKVFEQFSGIQIDGGAGGSRSNPQHSFRLEFNSKAYGEGTIEYPMIPDRPDRKKYKSLYLRNGSNQWLTFQFKDAMETKIMSNKTNNDYSHCTPAVVYINGSYFGVYEMREKLNDEYFKENYKATIDSTFQLLSLSYYYNSILRALNGSVDSFTTDFNKFITLNSTSADYLQKADQILDIDYYTDYIIAQSYIADTDWPFNNIKIVKGDFTNHRWRFLLQDLEWALSPNGWTNSSYDHINYMLYSASGPYIGFWKELIKNPIYKKQFINRFADIMNSSYLPENTIPIAQSIYDTSFSEMRGEYVRWNGGEAQATYNMTQYANNLALFKGELNARSNVVRSNILSNFNLTGEYTIEIQVQPENAGVVQINTITPEVYPWTGIYFAGVPIKMEAKGMGNYVFDGWEPNAIIKDVKNPIIAADVKINGYKFIAKFKKVLPEQAITISEINYNSSNVLPASDWIELFNCGQTAMDLTGWYITDSDRTHKWVIPGTVSVLPGDRLVLASNASKFSAVYPNIKNVLGSFEFGLGTPSDSVQLFDNNNKLIAGVKYSSDLPWDIDANGTGKTLELKDPSIGLNIATNWFAGCVGGSPGTAYIDCNTGTNPSLEVFTPKLYPNPASDQVSIVLPSTFNAQKMTCRIFDSMGKEMKAEAVGSGPQNILKYSVSTFPQGIYIVQLLDGTMQKTLKFVKQ